MIKNRKCAKQTTVAIIYNNGNSWIGSNWCKNPQETCPRIGMKTGEGYHLCKDICQQNSHAEVDACLKAGDQAKGGTLVLYGHYYCCDNCVKVMNEYGIEEVFIMGNINHCKAP